MALNTQNVKVLAGEFDLSTFLNNVDLNRSRGTLDTTAFGDASETFILDLKTGSLDVSGWADTTATGINKILDDDYGTDDIPVTYTLAATAGAKAYLLSAAETTIGNSGSIPGLLAIDGTYTADQDGVDDGVLLLPVTTATATANGATYDRGTSTKTGAVGILHVTTTDRTTGDETMDVVIQHSASSDMSGAATLIAFTTGTTVAVSERVETTTDPLRYIRASYTIAGTTPSFVFAVSWAAR